MSRTRKPDVVGIKIRLGTELVSRLEAAAKKRKPEISFNHECAARLGKSFAEEDAFGGEDGRQIMYFLTSAFILAGNAAAKGRNVSQWKADPKAYVAAMAGVLEAMLSNQPPGVSITAINTQLESIKGRVATRRLLEKGLIS